MPTPARPRLLLVDDSRVQIKMLRKLLADSEFEVCGEGYRGQEAIDQYRRLTPDAVVMDIVMPDMDGIKALEGIRAVHPGALVVMASSLGTKEKVMEALKAGAKSFLMKPYEREDLLRVLRGILRPAPAAAPTAKFFGQFLLERGRVNREQLLEAVRAQEGVNVKLGTLAIDRGYMTADAVKKLNRLQRTIDKKLGELAVEQGLLTKPQVEELLTLQKKEHLLLGEALVQKGVLTLQDLAEELAAFRKDQEGLPAGLNETYRGQPGAEVLTVFADVLAKMFLRLAEETVRSGVCATGTKDARLYDFTFRQGFRGDFEGTCCLSLTTDLLLRIASRMLEENIVEPGETARDAGAEFVNIVNGNVCAKLGSLGRVTELDPPMVHDNRGGNAFDLAAAANGGRVTRTPLLHPHSGIEFCLIERAGN